MYCLTILDERNDFEFPYRRKFNNVASAVATLFRQVADYLENGFSLAKEFENTSKTALHDKYNAIFTDTNETQIVFIDRKGQYKQILTLIKEND